MFCCQLGQKVMVESRRSEILQTWTQALIAPFVQIRLVKVSQLPVRW